MRETIYTRALRQAVEAQGSRQALASVLRVPENTLLRWLAGSAQTPVQAFCKVIELLVEHEKTNAAPLGAADEPVVRLETLEFATGGMLARCARCNGTAFALLPPATTLRYTSELRCCTCNTPVLHGSLISGLARESVQAAARGRKQPPVRR
jgi:hypothetical protein